MENRWSDRRELQLDVDLFRDGAKVCSCQSRDVGLGGAFLELQYMCSLDQDENIELVFYLISGQSPIKYNLRGKIVRVSSHGVGLKFHEFDTGVFRSLQEIMSYKTPERMQQ